MTDKPEPLLTIGEVATLKGMSAESVRRYSNDGRLPHVRTPGGQRRYRRSVVDEFFASLDTGAAQ